MIELQEITSTSFVSKWNTALTSTGSSSSSQIKLPLVSSGTYDFTVDWGDGTTDTITIYNQAEATHTYISAGIYTIVIDDTLIGWQFNNGGDKWKIIEISQWGNMSLGNTAAQFFGADYLVLTATDAPDLTGTTSLFCTSLGSTGSMDTWNVSGVTDMFGMFYYAINFDQSIDNWNVSNVIYMFFMFRAAESFNQPINNWDVSSVIDMGYMFSEAYNFNQPLDKWDVSSVTEMWDMFYGVTLSSQNYDNLLVRWSGLALQSNINFHGGYSKYTSNAVAARQYIIDTYGWSISDGGFTTLTYPDVSSPDDISYRLHATGNQIVWAVGDVNPDIYNITMNGNLYTEGTWTNGTISVGIDGFAIDVYEFIINVYDQDGSMASDTVILVVLETTPTDVSSPNDFSYSLDATGNQLVWTVGGGNPGVYNITRDGILVGTTQTWINGTITLDIDGLGIGVYEFIIFVYDTYDNLFSDAVIVTVNENISPNISSPDDLNYKLDETGNLLEWIVGDENPGFYTITVDEILHAQDIWINGTISTNVDGLAVGMHMIILYIYDIHGNMVSDAVIVTVLEINPPEISSPGDFSYKLGTTGNLISWVLGDVNPGEYNITMDGILIGTTQTWVNGTISVNIDGLDLGVYEFIIYVYDIYGYMASDTVIVTITEIVPPDISSPNNISYELNTTGNQINWTVGDNNPEIFNITLDGILYEQGTWTNGTISLNIDDLLVGVYIITLYVFDIHGNWAFDAILVVVNEPLVTETVTDTTTEQVAQ